MPLNNNTPVSRGTSRSRADRSYGLKRQHEDDDSISGNHNKRLPSSHTSNRFWKREAKEDGNTVISVPGVEIREMQQGSSTAQNDTDRIAELETELLALKLLHNATSRTITELRFEAEKANDEVEALGSQILHTRRALRRSHCENIAIRGHKDAVKDELELERRKFRQLKSEFDESQAAQQLEIDTLREQHRQEKREYTAQLKSVTTDFNTKSKEDNDFCDKLNRRSVEKQVIIDTLVAVICSLNLRREQIESIVHREFILTGRQDLEWSVMSLFSRETLDGPDERQIDLE